MPTNYCTHKVAANIEALCSAPVTTGIKSKGYIINKDDITAITITNGVVTALTLATGAKAFVCHNAGKTPYTGTQTEMASFASGNKFTNTIAITIPDNSPDVVKDVINPLANGEFVVVLENNYSNADGDNAFQVYGAHNGLRAASMVDGKYNDDVDGGWAITLTEEKAPTAALFMCATSGSGTATRETTRTYLEALLTTQV